MVIFHFHVSFRDYGAMFNLHQLLQGEEKSKTLEEGNPSLDLSPSIQATLQFALSKGVRKECENFVPKVKKHSAISGKKGIEVTCFKTVDV